MTPAQYQTLKVDIAADPALASQPMTTHGHLAIVAAYNLAASPTFTVWRTSVRTADIMANGFIWADVDVLLPGKARIWEWMKDEAVINPSKANVRQGLVDAFGAGTPMAAAILPLLKRSATRGERLFATGVGSVVNPGILVVEGLFSLGDVETARNLP